MANGGGAGCFALAVGRDTCVLAGSRSKCTLLAGNCPAVATVCTELPFACGQMPSAKALWCSYGTAVPAAGILPISLCSGAGHRLHRNHSAEKLKATCLKVETSLGPEPSLSRRPDPSLIHRHAPVKWQRLQSEQSSHADRTLVPSSDRCMQAVPSAVLLSSSAGAGLRSW